MQNMQGSPGFVSCFFIFDFLYKIEYIVIMYYEFRLTKLYFLLDTLVLVAGAATSVLFLYWVNTAALMELFAIPCVLKSVAHLYCPGCGGTRALAELAKGHLWLSFRYHPILVYTLWWVALYWVKGLVLLVKEKGEATLRVHSGVFWGLLVIIVGLFVVRNALLVLTGYDFIGDLAIYYI